MICVGENICPHTRNDLWKLFNQFLALVRIQLWCIARSAREMQLTHIGVGKDFSENCEHGNPNPRSRRFGYFALAARTSRERSRHYRTGAPRSCRISTHFFHFWKRAFEVDIYIYIYMLMQSRFAGRLWLLRLRKPTTYCIFRLAISPLSTQICPKQADLGSGNIGVERMKLEIKDSNENDKVIALHV